MTETNINISKRCPKCGEHKEAKEFHNDKTRGSGKFPYCKLCVTTRLKKDYAEDAENQRALRRADYAKNKDAYKARAVKWAAENKEKRREISKRYAAQNPGARKETATAYRLANSGLYAAHYKARQTRKQRAMPIWANTDKISRIYKACAAVTRVTGAMHHVDHFYPLKSDFVCGLHNEFNLRIITASDNLSKSNSLPN